MATILSESVPEGRRCEGIDVRLWPFGRKPKREHYLGEYTEPSFRGAFAMLVFSVVVVALLWLAYSWALNQPEIHDPNGVIDRVTAAVGALAIR